MATNKSLKVLVWVAFLWTIPYQYGFVKGFQQGLEEMRNINEGVDRQWNKYVKAVRRR